jgi:membrane-associated protein
VITARFVALVRTFTPVVAGAVGMPRRRFTAYNVAGGLLWTAGMLLTGYFLGAIPFVAAHVELTTLALDALVVTPAVVAFLIRWWRRAPASTGAPEKEFADSTGDRHDETSMASIDR